MNGLVVVNPEVLIARVLERGGRAAPGLDFIRWRLMQLRAEVQGASMVWTRFHRDIARVRAKQLAEARKGDRKGPAPETVQVRGGSGLANLSAAPPRPAANVEPQP